MLYKTSCGCFTYSYVLVVIAVVVTFAFLSSLQLPRALTAQNTLISEKNTAKVSNFELARDAAYNYVGLKLPIKWTAPEAIPSGVSGSKLEDGQRDITELLHANCDIIILHTTLPQITLLAILVIFGVL